MEKKLLEWFKKTGYPLELWTESILSEYDFQTTSSLLYQDQETKIYRELDLESKLILASEDKKTILSVNLLIECKKSVKPFVLLSNKKEKQAVISIGEYYSIEEPSARIAINNPDASLHLSGLNGTGFKLIQGFVNGDETPHKAMNTLIKSYNDYLVKENELLNFYIEDNINSITFPLLLIDAPFYEMKVGNDNKLELREINSGIIYNLSHLSKHYPCEFPVPVIRKESFEKFLNLLTDFATRNLNFLIQNPENGIINFKKKEIKLEPN